jgi:hypothetical protein
MSLIAMRDTGRCVVEAVVRGRYEESVGAMEVIGRQEKSVVAMQIHWSLWRGYGCCGKSAVAEGSQWLLW